VALTEKQEMYRAFCLGNLMDRGKGLDLEAYYREMLILT
jgi:hypothetical protein